MAVSLQDIKDQVLLVLYDYMLTSDEEAFWFSVPAIKEGVSEEISGAMLRRAIDSLVSASTLERGEGDGFVDVFALTDRGILEAETSLVKRGLRLEDYVPAPSADRIISSIDDAANVEQISEGLSEIAREIRENNEIGDALGDDRELLQTEVEAAETIVGKERFRLSRLLALIIPTLRYLARKFADQGVGELAKKLIKLLLSL